MSASFSVWNQRWWAIKALFRWRRDYGAWLWPAFWDAFLPKRHTGREHMVPVCPVCETRHVPTCRDKLGLPATRNEGR